MKLVSNKTNRPIRISLPGGKVLHLGPLKTGQIADTAAERPSIRKLLESGEIEIHDEDRHSQGSAESGGAPQGARRGHPQNSSPGSKGDR